MAYILLRALRQFGLADTELAAAQCDTIRVKLLKIGAVVRVTARKVWVSLSEAYRRDRRKDYRLQREGYFVLRFLAEDVVLRLEEILETILDAITHCRSP